MMIDITDISLLLIQEHSLKASYYNWRFEAYYINIFQFFKEELFKYIFTID